MEKEIHRFVNILNWKFDKKEIGRNSTRLNVFGSIRSSLQFGSRANEANKQPRETMGDQHGRTKVENIIARLKKTKSAFCSDTSSVGLKANDLCIKKDWKIDRAISVRGLEILSRHVLPGKMWKWKCFPVQIDHRPTRLYTMSPELEREIISCKHGRICGMPTSRVNAVSRTFRFKLLWLWFSCYFTGNAHIRTYINTLCVWFSKLILSRVLKFITFN